MRWSTQRNHDKRMKKYYAELEWHEYFAWYPVTDNNNDWYWLEYVDRIWKTSSTKGKWRGYYLHRKRRSND